MHSLLQVSAHSIFGLGKPVGFWTRREVSWVDPGVNKAGYHRAPVMSGAPDLVLDQITPNFSIPINLVTKFFSLEKTSARNSVEWGLDCGCDHPGQHESSDQENVLNVLSLAVGLPGSGLGLGPGSQPSTEEGCGCRSRAQKSTFRIKPAEIEEWEGPGQKGSSNKTATRDSKVSMAKHTGKEETAEKRRVCECWHHSGALGCCLRVGKVQKGRLGTARPGFPCQEWS